MVETGLIFYEISKKLLILTRKCGNIYTDKK